MSRDSELAPSIDSLCACESGKARDATTVVHGAHLSSFRIQATTSKRAHDSVAKLSAWLNTTEACPLKGLITFFEQTCIQQLCQARVARARASAEAHPRIFSLVHKMHKYMAAPRTADRVEREKGELAEGHEYSCDKMITI
eukprot:3855095-Amphidinium_carterae.1